ncbi:hypothetical protein N656DRAFT_802455 [Canariomyces notabilis]|uniref:Uncharacterized protein n=1 Tax=Canariomyces notabilis TaxID=2074819 RepID=A0AAN6T8F1_9PEZI|nr:hypothetical protein N656DRAFT_802455 [Canariomyces arenarius]
MPSPQDYSQDEKFHHEGGMPSALGHGVRGGEPTTERERQATGYAVAGNESGQVRQNDSVDADQQLETFAEGDVARAVAKKSGAQRYQYNDENDTSQSGDLQLESLHGRGRGEVSLEANEADLERRVFLISKKAQQSVAREQIKDARKMGVDVDGRGQTGPSGRQPRAEID